MIEVLHVDDEEKFLELSKSFFEREVDSISVETATSVEEALNNLDEDIDCVVSDYDIPEANGLEFLEEVQKRRPNIPFILFTGKGSEQIASEAISRGATDYFQKESGTGQFSVLANRIVNSVSQYRNEEDIKKESDIDEGQLQFAADTVPTQPDRPVEKQDNDELQRTAFAKYLARRITAVNSPRAYSIHLHGPWGSGKSTLLNFLETELREKGSNSEEYQIVRFNAWQHQHIHPPWWSLMDSIYQQTKSELSPQDQLSEAWWRLRSGRLGFFVGTAVLAWIIALSIPIFFQSSASLQNVASIADTVGKILAVFVTVWASVQAVTNSLLGGSAQAAQSYVEYVGDPMNTIKDRFNRLISRVPQPVAIFIDDLDRCDCPYVVELLEGIQTLFTDAPVVFVVAADRQWLINCFEEEYKDQQSTISDPAKSLGGRFLEKTFQFSTPIPTIPEHMKEEYWKNLLLIKTEETSDETESREIQQAESEQEILDAINNAEERSLSDQQFIRSEAVERLAAPDIVEHTEHILRPFLPLLEPNPRSMKRLVNKYSVNRALAILSYIDIKRDHLALWTILSLQYPKLADFLRENPDMVEEIGEKNPSIKGELADLFTDNQVIDIVNGEPVQSELNSTVVKKCASLQS